MGECLIFDLETDGLLDAVTKLHSIQLGTVDGDDVTVYCDALPGYPSLAEGRARASSADTLIGHNAIAYDFEVMAKLHPGTIRKEQIVDTLVMARLFNPEERINTLGAWGERLGVSKGDFKGPWDVCTPEMMEYAAKDIPVTRALYHHLKEVETWGRALALETAVAWIIAAQERNGFRLDVRAAMALDVELRGRKAALETELQALFPPIERRRMIVPKRDNKTRGLVKGVEAVAKTWLEPFNPGSRHHIAERLMAVGWKPKSFGDSGAPNVDEKILASIAHPSAKPLLEYFRVTKQLGQISDGKEAWLKAVRPDGRVYGRVNPNGAVSGRMTHSKPNMAQVDKKDLRMRAVWTARPGWVLVGCDAEGLEARMLASYLHRYDKGLFADRVVNGKKEDGTDVHSANLSVLKGLGLVTRNGAKTILYALMYGAGPYKLGETIKGDARSNGGQVPRIVSKELGALVKRALAKSMVGIDKLLQAIEATVKTKGYLTGLDGRHLRIRSPHAALNTLLQGGGGIVMKQALVLLWDALHAQVGPHGSTWALCANVHDEWQIEAHPEVAPKVAALAKQAITEAGIVLGVRCALAGSSEIGANWAETH